MQDAIAACGEKTADASWRAEGESAVGNEQYICKLVDGQVADGVEVCCRSVDAARFVFLFVMIIYSELDRTIKNTTVVFTDYFIP